MTDKKVFDALLAAAPDALKVSLNTQEAISVLTVLVKGVLHAVPFGDFGVAVIDAIEANCKKQAENDGTATGLKADVQECLDYIKETEVKLTIFEPDVVDDFMKAVASLAAVLFSIDQVCKESADQSKWKSFW